MSVVLLCAALVAGSATAPTATSTAPLPRTSERPAPRLRLADACGRAGFEGTLADASATVRFESCATATGARSTIQDASGATLVEVDVDARAGVLAVAVGGVPLGEATTPAELDAMHALLDTAAARLVRDALWAELTTTGGKDPATPAMAALAVQLVVYELLVPGQAGDDCLGCCGAGCWGCSGCFTQACLLHDLCVSMTWHSDLRCTSLFHLAATSAWCCRGIDLGPLCD